MKKTLIIIIATLSFSIAEAQSSSTQKIDTIDKVPTVNTSKHIFTAIQSAAEYLGGTEEFFSYIIKHLKISPSEFVRGTVWIRFLVDVDGRVKEPTIIKGMVTEGMKNKILEIFNEPPLWKPGIQNGKRVRIQYTIPLNLD
jgi:hypothetical protein